MGISLFNSTLTILEESAFCKNYVLCPIQAAAGPDIARGKTLQAFSLFLCKWEYYTHMVILTELLQIEGHAFWKQNVRNICCIYQCYTCHQYAILVSKRMALHLHRQEAPLYSCLDDWLTNVSHMKKVHTLAFLNLVILLSLNGPS